MSDRTDTERLDWLERNRAEVFSVTDDEWDVGAVPELLRFDVIVDYYKTRDMPGDDGVEGGFANVIGEGKSIREAIDRAIELDTGSIVG